MQALENGGVMYAYIDRYSDSRVTTITFEGNSTVKFIDNHADDYGGVMYLGSSHNFIYIIYVYIYVYIYIYIYIPL